ncbi:MAG: SDR family oxidoreductase [Alphaproteobacteria bacterium]|nr:SDR family oxidoreductase [Alphaproteobacteria bacterium]
MNRTALITGGASGIGAATARLLAARGWTVAINYRSRGAQATALVDELRQGGAQAVAIQADMLDPAAIVALFERVDREIGRLDALINSAGIGLPRARVAEFDAAQLSRLMAVNVVGVMMCCREAARRMSTAAGGRGGTVVNVSSMAATIGGRPGNSHYAASKAAVDSFSIGFAKEVAREGIRVVSVRPGVIRTEMTQNQLADPHFAATVAASIPIGRAGKADEVAGPIAWLLSDEASFVTGCCLDVSGGGFHIASAPR